MKSITLTFAIASLLAAGSAVAGPDKDADFNRMLQGSFRDQGIATVDRLKQDESNALCSKALGEAISKARAQAIEGAALKSVRQPTDGKYLGDWKEGEKLAQNGRGMTWTDKSADSSANGGNCYNCHQISKDEVSYGTIGPSLYRYGVIRGVTDPDSPAAKPIVEYTWNKLYNAKAYNACSGMPRFGHNGLLDETQLKHLMALLLDPQSVANR